MAQQIGMRLHGINVLTIFLGVESIDATIGADVEKRRIPVTDQRKQGQLRFTFGKFL
ncbi:MAG: hypothetical protein WDN69_35860 [Aliidongia sp.]